MDLNLLNTHHTKICLVQICSTEKSGICGSKVSKMAMEVLLEMGTHNGLINRFKELQILVDAYFTHSRKHRTLTSTNIFFSSFCGLQRAFKLFYMYGKPNLIKGKVVNDHKTGIFMQLITFSKTFKAVENIESHIVCYRWRYNGSFRFWLAF